MMNIRKFFKVRNYYLLLGVIMINVGCTKNFLEYNTNPNEATDEMTDWDNVRTGSLLLQMEQNVLVVAQPGLNIGSDRYQTVEVMGGDGYVGYFGFPAPSINSAGRYNWDKRSWYGDMFTTNYLTTMNAWREIRKAINNDEDPRFSMAQILKVAAMHRVTDTYGPIPYLEFQKKCLMIRKRMFITDSLKNWMELSITWIVMLHPEVKFCHHGIVCSTVMLHLG